jgi:tetratricopeptide (TPR) repeat protein
MVRLGSIHRITLVLTALVTFSELYAQPLDPYDPFDFTSTSIDDGAEADTKKSADELLLEATILMQDERLLDARTKLLRALEKSPKSVQVHSLLSGYYLAHVGHFRLALKYIKRALELFAEENGQPPYTDYRLRIQHGHLLYLLSQARLNLDDYQGSLGVLDKFTSHGYVADWYNGSRAWILMKLNRMDEAVAAARLAVLSGEERGRSLNVLGILLSMRKDRQDSLNVFREAIAEELSLGTLGQPATPLNNSGEVYKEIFLEDKAEGAWLRATGMPDGCEHVLPSLNLTLLYIDQLNLNGAKRTLDNFESCIAQYPLRNGEEHRALVELARGRIALHAGNANLAVEKFESALEHRQWFGKIGTNQDDLYSAALISLAQALTAQANASAFVINNTTAEAISAFKTRGVNRVRAWWLFRRARQVLIEDLNDLEDLYVRNTDSLLEYPTLGQTISAIPASVLETRLAAEKADDPRSEASLFYQTYLGENLINAGSAQDGIPLLNDVVNRSRAKFDALLRLRAVLVLLTHTDPGSEDYASLAEQAFTISRPSLRNTGLKLPVNFIEGDEEIIAALSDSAFILDNSRSLQYSVSYYRSPIEIELHFRATTPGLVDVKVRGSNLNEAVNKFTDEIFSLDLS